MKREILEKVGLKTRSMPLDSFKPTFASLRAEPTFKPTFSHKFASANLGWSRQNPETEPHPKPSSKHAEIGSLGTTFGHLNGGVHEAGNPRKGWFKDSIYSSRFV